MCGRYQRRSDKQRIAETFGVGKVDGLHLELVPNYNVAPQTMQPVVIWDERYGVRTLTMMYWRFLPPFCDDPKTFKLSTTNASASQIRANMWNDSFIKRRCLIPVDSFVEWQVEGRERLPWLYAMATDEPFALGGVWTHWRSRDGRIERDTFAIITVDPNELVTQTAHHDRMPLIVKKIDWQRWLEPGSYRQPPLDLLRPFDPEYMKGWRVSTKINSTKNSGPELSEPIKEDDDRQMGMFES
jgi:putative SOS response-associated peptidase YedK